MGATWRFPSFEIPFHLSVTYFVILRCDAMRKMVLETENEGLDSVRFHTFGRSADDWSWISRSRILSVGACGATFWGTFDPAAGFGFHCSPQAG